MSSNNSELFTCLTCQVAFHSADRQRSHYHSDWHRYNLKRKVAELPPVSADSFASKVLAQKNQNAQVEEEINLYCQPCRKDFASENSYNNHMQSKKHKENEIKYNNQEVREKQVKQNKAEDEQEDEEDLDEEQKLIKLIDAKIARSVKLTEVDCIFCTYKSNDFESNLEHMEHEHSFFIPDIEYLVDIKGMIKYLGEKVSIANVCLYCNGKGRELKSLEAVRLHMIDKGHTKIAYDDDIDIMEVSDFYDFSKSYQDIENIDPDQELSARPVTGGVELAENEMELVLPSGARLGHRSLARYYKQYIRPVDEQETRSRRMIDNASYKSNQPIYESRGRRLALTNGEHDKLNHKQIFKDKRLHDQYTTRIGINANRLQRHFREQIL